MNKFFFNSETLLACDNLQEFVTLFTATIKEYGNLVTTQGIEIYKGIITEKLPSELHLGSFSLAEAVEAIQDRDIKRLAFAYFKNDYPISDFFTIDNVEHFLQKQYSITIQKQQIETLYTAYVASQQGFLFTVPIYQELRKNIIELTSQGEAESILAINNLFGREDNTIFIRKVIEKLSYEKLGLLEKIKHLLGNAVLSQTFDKDFLGLNNDEQQSVLIYFEKAKNRNFVTPFYPDTKIISDVTPNNAKHNIKVYELRIYTPTAMRVYFYETPQVVFLASIDKKSNPNQSSDIITAYNILKKLVLTYDKTP
jgi:hypothetical protein